MLYSTIIRDGEKSQVRNYRSAGQNPVAQLGFFAGGAHILYIFC